MMKLGKKAARVDSRTLKMAKYLKGLELPPLPVAAAWSVGVKNWPMDMNDQIGDCTIAGAVHLQQLWTAMASDEVVAADDKVLSAYEAVSGYNPSDPSTDQGADLLTVLNYWRNTGINGRKILAYVQIDPKNIMHVQYGIHLFGGLYCGVQLPLTAQTQSRWVIVPAAGGQADPGSWGGHCIPLVDYDQTELTCVTWGSKIDMDYDWWKMYADEAYAIISPDWFNGDRESPAGFDMAALTADLQALA